MVQWAKRSASESRCGKLLEPLCIHAAHVREQLTTGDADAPTEAHGRELAGAHQFVHDRLRKTQVGGDLLDRQHTDLGRDAFEIPVVECPVRWGAVAAHSAQVAALEALRTLARLSEHGGFRHCPS
jgi:hypothetical protein